MKYVFTAGELIARQFGKNVYEGKEEGENGPRETTRRTSEDILKPYDQSSPASQLVRDEAVKLGMESGRFYAAYPMYKMSEYSYVFYDPETERAAELMRPTVHKSGGGSERSASWHVRLGDKKAEETSGSDEKRSTAGELKNDFTEIRDMWLKAAANHMAKKKNSQYTPVSTITELPVRISMFKGILSYLRTGDLMNRPKRFMSIEDIKGKLLSKPVGGVNAFVDPLDKQRFEAAAGAKGIVEWYEKHIGKLASAAGGSDVAKKSKIFGRRTIGEIFANTGILDEQFNRRYDNITLLRIVNAIIQQNPYASPDTKKKWREILKSIYEKYNILSTEGLSLNNEEYYGPELYNTDVEKTVNDIADPKYREAFRHDITSLVSNYILKGEGLMTPVKRGNEPDETKLGLDRLVRTGTPLGGYKMHGKNESLYVPAFNDFMFEAESRKYRYNVEFSEPMRSEDILDISPYIKEVRQGRQTERSSMMWVEADSDVQADIKKYIDKRNEEDGTDIQVLNIEEISKAGAADDWYVEFTGNVSKEDILGIGDYVIDAVSQGSGKKWNIKVSSGSELRDDLYDMANSKGVNVPVMDKIAGGGEMNVSVERERAEAARWDKIRRSMPFESMKKEVNRKLTGGVYFREADSDVLDMIIFDAIDTIGGYVVAEHNDSEKYDVRVVPSEENFKMIAPPDQNITDDTVVIKSSDGYLLRDKGVDKYTTDIRDPHVAKFKDESEAKSSMHSGSNKILNYFGELSAALREEYNAVKSKYITYAANTLFIMKADAEKSFEKGNKKAKSVEEMPMSIVKPLIVDMYRVINWKKIKTSGEKAEARTLTSIAKEKGHAASYEDVKKYDKQLAYDLEKYGTDSSFFYTATPSDYLEKAAELINEMAGKGAAEGTVSNLVNDWYHFAEMALSLTGGSIKRSNDSTQIPDDALKTVVDEMKNDETLEKNDPVLYFVAKAFTQMFIRDIGRVHVSRAMTGGMREKTKESQPSNFAEEMNKFITTDYLSTATLAEIFDKYMNALNNEQNNRPIKGHEPGSPEPKLTRARRSVLDVVEDVFMDLKTKSDTRKIANQMLDKIGDIKSKYPVDEETISVLASGMDSMEADNAAKYKQRLVDAITGLYNMSIE